MTLPSDARLSFDRTNAPPLPGLTCWNSRILKTVQSTSMWLPFLNWLVLIMASGVRVLRRAPEARLRAARSSLPPIPRLSLIALANPRAWRWTSDGETTGLRRIGAALDAPLRSRLGTLVHPVLKEEGHEAPSQHRRAARRHRRARRGGHRLRRRRQPRRPRPWPHDQRRRARHDRHDDRHRRP